VHGVHGVGGSNPLAPTITTRKPVSEKGPAFLFDEPVEWGEIYWFLRSLFLPKPVSGVGQKPPVV